jgi:hypothetical protein
MFTSRTTTRLPIPVRWTFVGLILYVDDYGRGEDEPRLIKAEVWPMDDKITPRTVEQHIDMIAEDGTVCRYQVDGERYLHLPSWSRNQRVSHPTDSRIPACPTHEQNGSHS